MADRSGYSPIQIALHWLIAVLIVGAWLTHEGMGRILNQRIQAGETGMEGSTVHTLLGGAVFLLVLIRLIVRFAQGVPGPVPGMSPANERAAIWGHRLLYLLMIVVPALGAAAWYGHVKVAGEIHELAGNLLMLTALGHAVMAIYHQVIRKDGTLSRMLRSG